MSKELDIYKALVDENPYRLNRAEIRRVIESKYSDRDIKKALDSLLDQRVINKIGREYSAGRRNLADKIQLAIVFNRLDIFENDRNIGFVFQDIPTRIRLATHRNWVLRKLIYESLEISLDSLRFELGLPIEKTKGVSRF